MSEDILIIYRQLMIQFIQNTIFVYRRVSKLFIWI